jgi:biopolymer transport protein ExbD
MRGRASSVSRGQLLWSCQGPEGEYNREMRIPSRAVSGGVGFNMTPMIDVVFQLIIFFLLSSHLAKQETQLALPLPKADSGQQDRGDRPRVTISVLADGTLLVANRSITPDEVTEILRQRRNVHGDDLEVRIRSDRGVPYSRVEPVMLGCARAGIWNVALAVHRRNPMAKQE